MDTITRSWRAFVAWYRRRPFIGGVLTVLGGVEMFFSGQLDLGNIHVQVGIEGFQATIIPIVLVLVGVLATVMPQHRIFYGVIALALAVYSLVGVNLGGFFVGMILASVGGVMIVSWMPRTQQIGSAPGDLDDDGESGGPVIVASDADAIASFTEDTDDDVADLPVTAAATGRRAASGGRTNATRRRATGGALAVALAVTTATGFAVLQPQQAHAAEATGVCVLGFIGDCSADPSPTPSATPTPAPSNSPSPSSALPLPGLPGASGADGSSAALTAPATPAGPALVAPPSDAPVFTGKPALLQGSSLSFSGLRYLGLASVHLSDGSTATVLKLSMDSVTIPDFRLDNRDANGSGVDTVATSMAFSGGVDTYCSSLKGILDNGASVVYDATHPPSSNGSVPVVRIISLEVFGITGGSSALTGFHEMPS